MKRVRTRHEQLGWQLVAQAIHDDVLIIERETPADVAAIERMQVLG